jgi:trans-aconitate methyltransferase
MFAAAAGYERYMGRWSRLLAPHYLAFAGVKDGQRILDIGTGTGSLAQALEAAFPQARVVGIDPSEAFVAYAKQHSRGAFEVGNAQALRFDHASFDHSMSMLVLNFIPDHEKALAEMRRVTRPQGVVSACVWDYAEGMQMLRIFWDAATALDPAAAELDEARFAVSRPGALAQVLRAAGLRDVRDGELVVPTVFPGVDDFWQPFLGGQGAVAGYLARLDESARDALAAEVRRRLPVAADGRVHLTARAWVARGLSAG